MVDKHQFAYYGTYNCVNFAERVTNRVFPTISLDEIGGERSWFFKWRLDEEDDGTWVFPTIFHDGRQEMRVHYYFNVLNEDKSKNIETEKKSYLLKPGYVVFGSEYSIRTYLNQENGYLNDNGELTVEYGIQVISILGDDGIWKFNVFDKISGNMSNNINLMDGDREWKSLHYHKQIVKLQPKSFWTRATFQDMALCFQIAHGVRIQIPNPETFNNIILAAEHLSLSNVIHYCEQKLIEKDLGTEWIKYAIDGKLNYHLAQLMKNLKSSKELKKILEDVDIQEMSGEAMKQCAIFFFKRSE